MSHEIRNCALPTPGDIRTCNRWACLKRIPAPGVDPAALYQLVETCVRDVASVIIADTEEDASPRPMEEYEKMFLDEFWPGVLHLADPHYPKALLANAENRGAMCLQFLLERMLPRLMAEERLLLHHQQFTWNIPDGRGGELALRGRITRVAEHKASKILRVYDWHIENWDAIDWQAYVRHQRAGIAAGWVRSLYPDHQVHLVKAYLASDVTLESTWTAEEQRGLELILRAQAMLAACAASPCRPPDPVSLMGRN
jgi:hypothetical protein